MSGHEEPLPPGKSGLKEFLGDWSPASTTVCVNSLSTPGARIEIDVIAVFPKG